MTDATQGESQPRPAKRRRFLPRTVRGRVILASTLVVAMAGAGTGIWWWLGRAEEAPAAATTRTITVSPTTLKTTVSATGTLEPERQADLTFGSSSTVTSVDVAVGDTVTEGQVLATVDDASLQIALDSAEADLTAAEESLAELEDSDDATDAAITAAEASVQVKTNALATAEDNLAAATMTAPFDGLVAEVNIAEGDATSGGTSGASAGAQTAATGTTSTGSSAAIVLISKDSYTVSTTVSSSDIASVIRGLQAELTVTGTSDTLYGTVSSVAVTASSSSSGTASFPVTIDLTGTQEGLFAGSSVSVEIIVSQLTDVIAVTSGAVTTNSDGTTTVEKMVDGVATTTGVTVGETIDGSVVITDGLAEGDEIQITVAAPTADQATDGSSQNSGRMQGFPGGDFQGGEMPEGFTPPDMGQMPGQGSNG